MPMNLAEQLVRDEGLALKPYTDTVGKLTIGVGRNLTDVGISKQEALDLLSADIARVQTDLARALVWTLKLDTVRRAVLLNMTFNMGIGGLLGFVRFLDRVRAGDYEQAAVEMLDSKWAGQVGDRAKRLAQQMQSGEWV